jgi:hypothetical protein
LHNGKSNCDVKYAGRIDWSACSNLAAGSPQQAGLLEQALLSLLARALAIPFTVLLRQNIHFS